MDRVEKLIGRIDHNRDERLRRDTRDQGLKDHLKTIQEAGEIARIGFFCRECDQDFDADGYKQVRYSGTWPVAWYAGRCPKGHPSIRYITDKHRDPYFYLSKMLARQRHEMADDMLTPDNPRFKIVYPEKWRKMEEDRENYEREQQRNTDS